MMWQKEQGKYHLLLSARPIEDISEGHFVQTGCGNQMRVRRKNQISYVGFGGKMCKICNGIWRINFTSVDDARHSIKEQTSLKVLRRALELADRVTLKRALESRIKKLEKEKAGA